MLDVDVDVVVCVVGVVVVVSAVTGSPESPAPSARLKTTARSDKPFDRPVDPLRRVLRARLANVEQKAMGDFRSFPQARHRTLDGCRFSWSGGCDHIFRNEEVTGSDC